MEGGHHQRLFDSALVGASGFLDDNHATFRQRLYAESPWWVPEGVDDRVFDKICEVLARFLTDVRASPNHDVRMSLDDSVADFARLLRVDPELHRRGEALKQELLDHPAARR